MQDCLRRNTEIPSIEPYCSKFTPQFAFDWGGTSGSASTSRSTIRFGQAMIWPVTHVPPAVDYTFFKKPLPVEVPAPPMGWKSPGASSTPLSKAPLQSSQEDWDRAEPAVDLTELDDDETFTPHKVDSLKTKEAYGSLKQQGSPPAKKACIEGSGSHKASKSKSRKASHAL